MQQGFAMVGAAMMAMVLSGPAAWAEEAGMISVSGLGRVDAAPDLATINVGVSTQAKTAREALSQNTERLAKVLAELKAAGVAERDLQTSGLSLGPVFDYSVRGEPRVTGYQVSNMLTVRVRVLESLGTVLDQTVSDGANEFRGLTFALAEPGPAMDAARVAAVKDARRKAEMMAEAAGVTLGKVRRISEQVAHVQPMMMMRADAPAMEASSVPIAEGEVSYSVTVNIDWEIKE